MPDKTETMREFDELLKGLTGQENISDTVDNPYCNHNNLEIKNYTHNSEMTERRDCKFNRRFDSGLETASDEGSKTTKSTCRGVKGIKNMCNVPSFHEQKLSNHLTSVSWKLTPGKKIKVNLPTLELPSILSKQDEESMLELHLLLQFYGFEVRDRKTLACFALGNINNTPAAPAYFYEFYKLASRLEWRFPDRAKMGNDMIEGAARQRDGTLGLYFLARKWNTENTLGIYVARENLCYFLNMVDLSVLRAGLTYVANMSALTWRMWAPFEVAKAANFSAMCIPLKAKRLLFIQPNIYARVALNMSFSMISIRLSKVACVLQLDEVHSKFPNIIIPPSLAPSTTESSMLARLSIDEQINFQILIDE